MIVTFKFSNNSTNTYIHKYNMLPDCWIMYCTIFLITYSRSTQFCKRKVT